MTEGENQTCAEGHRVPAGNNYCTTCGQPVALPQVAGGTHQERRTTKWVVAAAAIVLVAAVGVAALGVRSGGPDDQAAQEQAFIAAVRADDEFTDSLTDADLLDTARLNCEQAQAGTLDQTFDAIAQASADLGEDPERVGRRVVLAINMLCPEHNDQLPDGTGIGSNSMATTTTSQAVSTTTDATTTSTTPPPVTAAQPVPEQSAPADGAEIARQAAVVYWTYGVPAEGYPTMEEVLSAEARPATDTMVLSPDYRNAGCTQIVDSITLEEGLSTPPIFGFTLQLRLTCPDGPPLSTYDGSVLPLTITEFVEVTVGPNPGGGLWATQVQLVDLN